jgi:serine beta-lactamase-like protein LACTB
MQFIKEKYGIPGLILGVSIDGRNEFLHSVGYADIENLTEMKANSCFRIASISKSITSICTALLLQEGKINLDAPIQDYVPTFPIKF